MIMSEIHASLARLSRMRRRLPYATLRNALPLSAISGCATDDERLFAQKYIVQMDGTWLQLARNFFLLLLNNSRQDQAAVA